MIWFKGTRIRWLHEVHICCWLGSHRAQRESDVYVAHMAVSWKHKLNNLFLGQKAATFGKEKVRTKCNTLNLTDTMASEMIEQAFSGFINSVKMKCEVTIFFSHNKT